MKSSVNFTKITFQKLIPRFYIKLPGPQLFYPQDNYALITLEIEYKGIGKM